MKYYIDDNFRIKSIKTHVGTKYLLQEKKKRWGVTFWKNTYIYTYQSVTGYKIKTPEELSIYLMDQYHKREKQNVNKDILK